MSTLHPSFDPGEVTLFGGQVTASRRAVRLDDDTITVDVVNGTDRGELVGKTEALGLWPGHVSAHDRDAILAFARYVTGPGVALCVSRPGAEPFLIEHEGNGVYSLSLPVSGRENPGKL